LTRPPSVKRLVVQVVIVAGLMVGLARWAGRGAGTGGAGGTPPADPVGTNGDAAPGTMSLPGDLTFYKTLGSGKPAPPPTGGLPSDTRSNDDQGGAASRQSRSGQGGYVVQALATRDLAAARRLKARLASRGFPAIVQEDRTETAVVYRVRAARYRTRAEAEAAVQILRRDLRLTAWILEGAD
jgi:hypothetical protein